MSETPERPADPPDEQGISLDELSRAYAEATGGSGQGDVSRQQDRLAPEDAAAAEAEAPDHAEDQPAAKNAPAADDDPCPISPQTILEAMLFVGDRQNEPLAPARAAELMRGVEPSEIPQLVDQLNCRYAENGCPYKITSEGPGYRLGLRRKFDPVRNKFYGRVREAQLSQAAIDVLAIVAYRQPLTGEGVSNLRGTPSSHVLAQLVRRRLLRIERPPGRRRPVHYYTTDRFLELFGLESLDDLPQAEELEPR